MAKVAVRGVKIYRSKGRTYAYHRASGTRIDAPIGSAEFFATLAAIEAAATVQAPRIGTLGALITAYRGGTHFRADLAPRTRADYQAVLDYLQPLSPLPLADIDRGFVVKLRDKARAARGRRFGTYVVQVVSALYAWAIERGDAAENPAKGVKRVPRDKAAPRANRPWTLDERSAVLGAAPPQLRLPILLGMYLGLREGDVVAAPLSAYDPATGLITVVTAKRRRLVRMAAPQPIRAEIAARPACDATTLCVSSRKRPWTESGFRASFFALIRDLRKTNAVGPGLTFHGLRHTVATLLRELGCDTRTIADVLGQATEAMAEHYAREADLEPKLRDVVKRLERAVDGTPQPRRKNEKRTLGV